MSSISSLFGVREMSFPMCFAHKLHFEPILLAGTFDVTFPGPRMCPKDALPNANKGTTDRKPQICVSHTSHAVATFCGRL